MMSNETSRGLITDLNVRQFFQDTVRTAVVNQQVDVAEDTVVYVVNLLTEFTRAEVLYEDSSGGRTIKPLVGFYNDAVEAQSTEECNRALKRLGDVALFISGLFSHSLQRSLVDVDYYIAMGGSAYYCLADGVRGRFRGDVFSDIYQELGEKFAQFVDVLSEVGDSCQSGRDQDVLRLYELWLLTGSKQAERKLRQCGIQPAVVSRTSH